MGKYVIKSVADVIHLINNTSVVYKFLKLIDINILYELLKFRKIIENNKKSGVILPNYKEPFGIWFRGEGNKDRELYPSVFRKENDAIYEETSMIYHFESRCGYKDECRNTFDWLCLMRHFEAPVRLLDWSENFLTALFFACTDCKDNTDGILYVLNAVKLNALCRTDHSSRRYPGIAVPLSVDTAVRAEMSRARTVTELTELLSALDRNYVEEPISLKKIIDALEKKEDSILESIRNPVAVLPHRIHTRLIAQQSVFTIHGGKCYAGEYANIKEKEKLPEPNSLVALNDSLEENYKKFLFSAIIPKDSKEKILKELSFLGIHQGTLFPELDHQSRHIKKIWSYKE